MNSTATLLGLETVAPRHPIPLNLRLNSSLDALTLHRVSLDIKEPGQCAVELFNHHPLLPGLILKQAGIFFGVLSRRRFYEMMSRPSSLEFFARRPLETLCQVMDVQIWSLPASTPIVVAARQALLRESDGFYEPIAVEVPTQGVCLLDIHELLLAQARIHEITMDALRESQIALMTEKELAQITLQSIGDGVITTDALGHVKSLNRIAECLTGWTHHQAQGQSFSQVFNCVDEDTRQPQIHALPTSLSEAVQSVAATGLLIDRQGRERVVDYSTSPIRDADGVVHGTVLVLRDITQQRRLARQLYWQANHDALTGLTNRSEFERLLQATITTARQIGTQHVFCYLDLDRFKIVNDTCGHLAGDELLRQISRLLQNQVRSTDVLARLGGDEFGVLLYDCSPHQGEIIAQAIRQEIQNFRFNWESQTFTIGVSVGLTIVDGHFDETEILRRGDMACYWAKHEGRNRVCQFHEMGGAYSPQVGTTWVSRLTHALNHEGFRLYQQKVNSTSCLEQTVHCELLLRLVDESGQLHLPGAFLSTAERYNLMPDIDRWVIHHALKAYAAAVASPAQGTASDCQRFAINLSGASLNDDHLLNFIQTELSNQGISPHRICFEITETVAIANLTRASAMIHALKDLGCQFALDDFGSGMSAFTYLKTLPVDFLKIDGSFIQDITTDAVAHAMVKSIHEVAQAMGLKTIAEWVDNEPTLNTLREIGIDYVQGYCIDQPRPLTI